MLNLMHIGEGLLAPALPPELSFLGRERERTVSLEKKPSSRTPQSRGEAPVRVGLGGRR